MEHRSPTHKPLLPDGWSQKPLRGATAHHPLLLQKYVQDVLQEQLAESVYRALKEQGGHIYVCGDVTMAADVLKAIQRIMTQQGKLSEEDAGVFISRLRVSDSWQPASRSFLSSNLYRNSGSPSDLITGVAPSLDPETETDRKAGMQVHTVNIVIGSSMKMTLGLWGVLWMQS